MKFNFFFKFTLLSIFFPFISFSQSKSFKVFGTLSGNYNSKIYLFFEGNFRQRDSISSEIKNGSFYFKGKIPMPIQGRLHMDQQSIIQDIYIDNSKIYVECTTNIKMINNGNDTMNMLSVISVKGSKTNKLKSDFEDWLDNLKKSKLSEEEINKVYYQNLQVQFQ